MKREHELKCWPEYYEKVVDGSKPFEARKNDRGFEVGDTLLLQEWMPDSSAYTGRETRRTITYILSGEQWLKEGVVILGLNQITSPEITEFIQWFKARQVEIPEKFDKVFEENFDDLLA